MSNSPADRSFKIPDPFQNEGSNAGRNYLLAIGIDAYRHLGKLHNCVADAKAFVEVLNEEYGFDETHTTEIYNEDATREGILSAFQLLSSTLTDQDNLLIYFAGHGYYKSQSKIGFLVPVDGQKEANWSLIFNSSIRDYIRGLPAHHIFLVVDSCFSGDLILRSRGGDTFAKAGERYADRVDSLPSRWGLAAGRIEEVADGIAGNHSPFNKSLVTFLKNHPTKSFAVSDLINHVSRITTYNADQTPIGGVLDKTGHQGGEFVFRRKLDEGEFWNSLIINPSENSLRSYLILFPSGNNREEAQWKLAQLSGKLEDFIQYRRDYSNGKYRQDALREIEEREDFADWQKAQGRASLSGYERYLEQHPQGAFVEEARETVSKLLKGEPIPQFETPQPASSQPAESLSPQSFKPSGEKTANSEKVSNNRNWMLIPIAGLIGIVLLLFLARPIWIQMFRSNSANRVDQVEEAKESREILNSIEVIEAFKTRLGSGYIYEEGGKYGLLKEDKESLLTRPIFDKIESFGPEGSAIIHVSNKRGFIGGDGKVFIRPYYNLAWNYGAEHKGLAKVTLNRETFYIDAKGSKTKVPSSDPPSSSGGGKFSILDTDLAKQVDVSNLQNLKFVNTWTQDISVASDGGKQVLMLESKKAPISKKYDKILPLKTLPIARVMLNNRFGYIDQNGKEIIKPQFDETDDFGETGKLIKGQSAIPKLARVSTKEKGKFYVTRCNEQIDLNSKFVQEYNLWVRSTFIRTGADAKEYKAYEEKKEKYVTGLLMRYGYKCY